MMRGAISKEETKELARKQRKMERLWKEQGKVLKNSRLKSKSLELKPKCEIEGRMVVTLKGRGKVVFTKMDKFEKWVRGRDAH
jgi:hypothetical protein